MARQVCFSRCRSKDKVAMTHANTSKFHEVSYPEQNTTRESSMKECHNGLARKTVNMHREPLRCVHVICSRSPKTPTLLADSTVTVAPILTVLSASFGQLLVVTCIRGQRLVALSMSVIAIVLLMCCTLMFSIRPPVMSNRFRPNCQTLEVCRDMR